VTAYVVNQSNCDGGHTVTPINTATGAALKAINVGKGPNAITITPDGKPA
jgi:DNA-binding beta-propeller fold protein YncE